MADENPSRAVPDAGKESPSEPSPLKDRGPAPPALPELQAPQKHRNSDRRRGGAGWRHFFVALPEQL